VIERTKEFDIELLSNIEELDKWCRKVYQDKYSKDITQEVCTIALEHGSFDHVNKMITWLCSIARNLYLNKFAYIKNHKSINIDELESGENESKIYILPIIYQPNNMEIQDIYNYIENLSRKQQQLINLTIQGYKVNEITIKLNIKSTSTKSKLCFIRKKFKTIINLKNFFL
jgi:RNA polymerase sigma factor (sigma-70 family)